MSRNIWMLGILATSFAAALAAISFFHQQPAAASTMVQSFEAAPADSDAGSAPIRAQSQQTITAGGYRWSFGVKFVCGYQPPFTSATAPQGEPVVKPGNYATEINIHNYNYKQAPLRKKVVVLVERGQVKGREPQSVGPQAFDQITLGPDYATMDDCNRIWQLLYPTQALPGVMPLMIGYLVIISPLDLDVDVVYTAAVPGVPTTAGQQQFGISQDVERVNGKRVYIPTGALPNGLP